MKLHCLKSLIFMIIFTSTILFSLLVICKIEFKSFLGLKPCRIKMDRKSKKNSRKTKGVGFIEMKNLIVKGQNT